MSKYYYISKKELKSLTGGFTIEELIESIDKLLLFVLFNAHRLDMDAIKDEVWALQLTKELLLKLKEKERRKLKE